MTRLFVAAALAAPLFAASAGAAEEVPSFLQKGDAFCTSQRDYDDFVQNGHVRPNSAIETCQTIITPTRVAVMGGQGGAKTLVRVMNGPVCLRGGLDQWEAATGEVAGARPLLTPLFWRASLSDS